MTFLRLEEAPGAKFSVQRLLVVAHQALMTLWLLYLRKTEGQMQTQTS